MLLSAGFAAGQEPTAGRSASELQGKWSGALQVGPQTLRLILEVPADDDTPAVLVSVDQGGARIPVDELSLDGDKVEFKVAAIRGAFQGGLNRTRDRVEGKWTQNGATLPLVLARSAE